MSTPQHRLQISFPQRLLPSSSQIDVVATEPVPGSGRSANRFTSSPHGHPLFTPNKSGNKGDSKVPKQPKAPDKPLMPYMRYSRKVWDSVKASNPDLKFWEIGRIIGQMWRDQTDEEKQGYSDEYDAEKILYTESLKRYHNSAVYQSWLSNKGKVDTDNVEGEEPEKSKRSKASGGSSELRTVSIAQRYEDDDAENGCSTKHIAAARYKRNHSLINEIFSDVVVPDVRSVVNEGRMTMLKHQVQSLTVHQKKLEDELEQLEQDHLTKKRNYSESSEQFNEDLAKLCGEEGGVTVEQFRLMMSLARKDILDKQMRNKQQEQIGQDVCVNSATPVVKQDQAAVTYPTTTSTVSEHLRNERTEMDEILELFDAAGRSNCKPTVCDRDNILQRYESDSAPVVNVRVPVTLEARAAGASRMVDVEKSRGSVKPLEGVTPIQSGADQGVGSRNLWEHSFGSTSVSSARSVPTSISHFPVVSGNESMNTVFSDVTEDSDDGGR